jgi:uncharacterized membrane protein
MVHIKMIYHLILTYKAYQDLDKHIAIHNFLYFFYIISMTKEEKKQRIVELKQKAYQLKIDVEYYNSLQTALKLILNGSYV